MGGEITIDMPLCPEPDWDRIERSAREWSAEARARVASWFWALAEADLGAPYELRPERFGRSVSRSPARRANPHTMLQYGATSSGDLMVACRFGGRDADVLQEERFWCQTPEGLEAWLTLQPERFGAVPIHMAIALPRRSRPDAVVTWHNPRLGASVVWNQERYERDDVGNVVTAETATLRGERHPEVQAGSERVVTNTLHAQWDELGLLAIVRTDSAGETRRAWRRPDRDADRRAEALVQQELPEAIRAWARRNDPGTAAYCVVIAYDDESGAVSLPSLGLGTVDDLHRWGPPGSQDRRDRMWNPAEFAIFDPEPDELVAGALGGALAVLEQEGRDATRLFRAVARSLRDEKTDLVRTPVEGFTVLAVDLELSRIDAALREAVPAAARRRIEVL